MTLAPTLENLVKELNKQYGAGAVRLASEIPDTYPISTGVVNLDADVGGGVPLSKITIFMGPEHSGKTTLALKAIANAQRTDRETYEPLEEVDGRFYRKSTGEEGTPMQCVYLNVEGSFGKDWAKALGVDLSRLLEINVEYQEQAYDTLASLILTKQVDLIVMDSLAMLTPSVEADSSVEDQQMGVAARNNNKGFRKLASVMNKVESEGGRAPAILIINQIRLKLGVMYGDPETMPGGLGQLFAASLIVRFRAGKTIEVEKEMVGREYHYRIKKNKVTGFLREGAFELYLADYGPYTKGDVNNIALVLDVAARRGLIEKGGAWYTINGERIQGERKAAEYLLANPDVYESLRQQVTEVLRSL